MNFLFFVLCIGAFASISYTCGDGWTCTFDNTPAVNKFTVKGTGEMMDMPTEDNPVMGPQVMQPWKDIINQIETIEIGEGVTRIGNSAFEGAGSVKKLILPNTLKKIGEKSFYKLKNLESLTLPDSLEVIESYGFANLEKMTQFPTVTEKSKLHTLGDNSFQSMGNGFYDHQSETNPEIKLVIPKSVKTLGGAVFSSMSLLTSVDCSEVKIFGQNVFSYSNSLENITLSSKVHTIDETSFSDLNSLKNIFVGEGGKHFKSIDGLLMKIGCGEMELFAYPAGKTGDIKIPEGTTVIGKQLFQSKSLTSFTFPSTLKIIRESAFRGNNFETLEFNEGLTTLEANAFASCTTLNTIKFSKTLVNIAKNSFDSCSHIEKFEVAQENPYFSAKDGVLYAKSGSVLVKYPPMKNSEPFEYILPAGIKVIYDGAFKSNTKVTKVTLQTNDLQVIRSEAFYGCSAITEVIIDAPVKSIGTSVFQGCSKLTKATIGDSVKMIGQDMFSISWGTYPLETLQLGNGILSIEKKAFQYSKIKEIVIPDSCKYIRENAFYGCNELTKVTIGSGVMMISENAFSGCTKLATVETSGTSMWRIDDFAFQNTAIMKMTIPSSVEIVNDKAFSGTQSLEEITYNGEDQPAFCSPTAFEGSSVTNFKLHDNYPQQEFCGIKIEEEQANETTK